MDNMTTTSVITPAVQAYFQRLLLVRNKPHLVHRLFADEPFTLPSGNGKTYVWRRYAQLSTATTEITEGITPPGKQLSKQDIRGTVSQYGDYILITDVLEFTCENNILNVGTSELNDQMLRTEDELIRNVIISSASAITCDTGDVTATDLNTTDIEQVCNTLQNNNAAPVAPKMAASVGQGTSPIPAAYWAIAHTELNSDWKKLSGWIGVHEYAKSKGVLEAERGSVDEARIVASSVAHKQGSATEAFPSTAGTYYYIPFIAKHAYGVVDLAKANAKLIIHARGTAGSADPIDQRQTAGWKFMDVCKILNDNNIIVLKCTKMV